MAKSISFERIVSGTVSCLFVVAVTAGCSSPSSGEDGPVGDAAVQPDSASNTPPDAGGSQDAGTGDAADAAVSSDPCSNVVGASGAGVKKMQKLLAEVAAGGTPRSGIYTLKYWGKQGGTVGVAYELEVNLRLTIGTPNTYAVSEYYQGKAHSGGGTFTFDDATKQIAFTKTCGEINVGLGAVDKGFYSVTPTEFKVFNFGLYGAGNILIFTSPP